MTTQTKENETMPKIKVSQQTNSSNIIEVDNIQFLQSYNIIVACKKHGKIYLDCNKWDYSNTTLKHLNSFLGQDTRETRKKIKTGDFILTNLN